MPARPLDIRVLFLGDVVGRPGRRAVASRLPALRRELQADLVVVNGENSAGGLGIDEECAREIRAAGADVITLGDHTFQRKEMRRVLEQQQEWCIRPLNYPAGAPGRGYTIVTLRRGEEQVPLAVMNVMGRTFMGLTLDCPFRAANALIDGELAATPIRVCDFHAEATSEKVAFARYLDGRISAVVGTHTHVQTADEQILPQGTALLSDLGMCGSIDGVIGMKSEVAIERFLSGLPAGYEVARGRVALCGAMVTIDARTGRASSIVRVREEVPE